MMKEISLLRQPGGRILIPGDRSIHLEKLHRERLFFLGGAGSFCDIEDDIRIEREEDQILIHFPDRTLNLPSWVFIRLLRGEFKRATAFEWGRV
ncbi:hypothetical protein [Methanocalculus sp. MSAO_Arc1]|uniref:hypothetical protein n=1 Tax=Methanocalculus sp. MSAO_Arc1 TaxID=2293854 RepID=UPI0025D1922E|nr:hypothetical protein [Methanocalculus sp. MSAO_Arc1]